MRLTKIVSVALSGAIYGTLGFGIALLFSHAEDQCEARTSHTRRVMFDYIDSQDSMVLKEIEAQIDFDKYLSDSISYNTKQLYKLQQEIERQQKIIDALTKMPIDLPPGKQEARAAD